ncbi:MAG: glycoside hydrolase family 3 protein [Lachnospiraceae bacterium]|nr:glycoside hydrolase family 3 protein [Lachnospiraceae bacterium]
MGKKNKSIIYGSLFMTVLLLVAAIFFLCVSAAQKKHENEAIEMEETAANTEISVSATGTGMETETQAADETVSELTTEVIAESDLETETEKTQESVDSSVSEDVEELLASLSLEEKIAQMFIITPEALTGADTVTAAGETTKSAFEQYPVGGLVYLTPNITSESQLLEMLTNTLEYSMERLGVPVFLCLDEEGGTVTRISGKGVIDVPDIGTMESVGQGEPEDAYETGAVIGSYLSDLLFNVDFAPVADVATNPENTVIGSRSFGSDPEKVSQMVASFVEGIQEEGVAATLKHFPGHGDTAEDSHTSSAISYKTIEELRECEFLPFVSGIEAGCRFIMVGHISLPNVTGDYTPATLSSQIITDILREELGYDGIVVTDAMNMAAVTNLYSSGDAAVEAIKAGADMILMPVDFQSAYASLLAAVQNGTITEERINESLRRILTVKIEMKKAE